MNKDVCVIQVSELERRILVKALMNLKERQIKEDKEYDFLDELIVRICDAPLKGKKHFYEER